MNDERVSYGRVSNPPLQPIHHRRSIRLKNFDYAQNGAYFVTICTHNRESLFGQMDNGQMRMNRHGELVEEAWRGLPNHYAHVALDRHVVMPDHFHGIVVLVGAGFKPAPTTDGMGVRHGLPEIVRAFKTFSARRINAIRQTPGIPVWQRNYYEHVIRDDADYTRIAAYIANNPKEWPHDSMNPENAGAGFNPAPGDMFDARCRGDRPVAPTEPGRYPNE